MVLSLSLEETIAKIQLITEKASTPLNFTAIESPNIYIYKDKNFATT